MNFKYTKDILGEDCVTSLHNHLCDKYEISSKVYRFMNTTGPTPGVMIGYRAIPVGERESELDGCFLNYVAGNISKKEVLKELFNDNISNLLVGEIIGHLDHEKKHRLHCIQ